MAKDILMETIENLIQSDYENDIVDESKYQIRNIIRKIKKLDREGKLLLGLLIFVIGFIIAYIIFLIFFYLH